MNRLFRTNIVETSGVRTIAGGGTNASDAGQALLNLSGVSITGNQIISGNKTFINNTNFSGTLNFNTANTGEVLDGQMNWNNDYGTLQIGMNNGEVINPVGFKSFYRVKAAENIRKGKVVMTLGGVGNSEYILAREAQNIGISGQLIMGVSAEEILANNYGDVTAFGPVRGVNTSSYPVDSILYFDTASTGEFTNTPPQAPNPRVIVALNTTSANNGIIFVRVGSDISNLYTNDNPSGFFKPVLEYYDVTGQTIALTSDRLKYIFILNTGISTTIFRLPTGNIQLGDRIYFQTLAGTTGNLFIQSWGGSSWGTNFATSKAGAVRPYIAKNTGPTNTWEIELAAYHGYTHNADSTDPISIKASQITDIDSIYYPRTNPSGYITSENVVYTSGNQTLSGNLSFEADEYIFSGSSVTITGNSILSVDQQTQTKGIVKDMGGASGLQVLTTGAYNAITPLSGVVYILI